MPHALAVLYGVGQAIFGPAFSSIVPQLGMFVVINLVTMLLPIGCLAFSRNVLGRDDPISDNISANVIGLFLGLVARFYLFRTFVFRRPAHVPHLSLPRHPVGGPTPPVSGTTDRSTRGRAQPPAP